MINNANVDSPPTPFSSIFALDRQNSTPRPSHYHNKVNLARPLQIPFNQPVKGSGAEPRQPHLDLLKDRNYLLLDVDDVSCPGAKRADDDEDDET